ncbi:MAG TPA: asparagine synthetase B [Bacteroidia bacterium]|nr:asparagine synthetase B [Sphingobacteriales bacterium]HPD64948.1 asparagine synthetase B [Bacteroidia bacterium]HRS58178.1 asparagine synthetase B [Bacteroidia bacterium]HRU67508.1 asparagine synthetase B [Bacteroidia bacterium]
MKIKLFFTLSFLMLFQGLFAAYLLIPMDESQKNHLKAYGITYWVLQANVTAEWLLNYRGGSFVFIYSKTAESECQIRGVSYEVIADAQYQKIIEEIANPEVNMEVVKLEKAPKIAVYSPKTKQPWDDAVTLVLTYAEIPYDVVYDDEVLQNKLFLYDWLHLHHEDFTGQTGKFYSGYASQAWYKEEIRENKEIAARWGYSKISQLKLAVAKKIKDFVLAGGYLFAMCAAADTYDIALAADGVDICTPEFDGDPIDPNADSKLNFNNTLAFQNFTLVKNPYIYEHSSIDATEDHRMIPEETDYFTLFDFSAKWDIIPTMLCQNHTRIIHGFMGQSTAFRKKYIKPEVLIMGENNSLNEARYIHGELGKGMWTFLGGHDPEDYQHFVYDPPTDLNLYPNSPGYRLILNNVLFPAAEKKKQKT